MTLLDRSLNEPPNRGFGRVVWGVGALMRSAAEALALRFPTCAVRGEVSNFSRAASGHCYFNLKDADGDSAVLRCALFRRAAGLLDFVPRDGQLVEVRGRLGVYESRGELQLLVEAMQRAGDGAAHEQFLRLKARLEAEGLFAPARKRSVVAFPRRIGVITSMAAAALRDVVTTLMRRSPQVEVIVYPGAVQGVDSPASLCEAIALAGRRREVDTLIVARGGGPAEDFHAFNDERVVRAIAAAPMPVICGVGHETDVTLADFAADLRAPTPTAAAELAAPQAQDCLDVLAALASQLQRRVQHQQDSHAARLDRLAMRLARPVDAVHRRQLHLNRLGHRFVMAAQRELERRRGRLVPLGSRWSLVGVTPVAAQRRELAAVATRLAALDPRRVLARGYAWLSDDAGRAIVTVRQLAVGDSLQAVLADGAAAVGVTGVELQRGHDGN